LSKKPALNRTAPRNAFQVGPGTVVHLRYAVYDADGEPVEVPEEAVEVLFGFGQILPAVERAIQGLGAGERRSIAVSPADGFGKRDPGAVIEVDRADFPPEVAAGDFFEAENTAGKILVLRVLDVDGDVVVLDTNHPLAGQKVRFEVEIHSVRPATEQELEAAAARLDGPPAAPDQLISPRRLLEGGGRRYDTPPSDPAEPFGPKRA
jgi:FKBP-type peptidyl-prolyl cis-trans isomerase SlyD